jgi:hypothetical protein
MHDLFARRDASMKQPRGGRRDDDLDHTIAGYWRASLLVGAVVIGVVALLLRTLTQTAEQINAGAAEIWRVGKLIANNTVHVPLLLRTNQVAEELLKTSEGIAGATTRISGTVTASSGNGAGSTGQEG